MLATEGRVDKCLKADSPSARIIRGQEGGNHMQKQHSQLTVILKSVLRGLTSIMLIVLTMSNLRIQGWLVSISLRPVLGVMAAYGSLVA